MAALANWIEWDEETIHNKRRLGTLLKRVYVVLKYVMGFEFLEQEQYWEQVKREWCMWGKRCKISDSLYLPAYSCADYPVIIIQFIFTEGLYRNNYTTKTDIQQLRY